MIYLKELNVIFLKPRKVAGTSFEIALSKYASDGDIITPIAKDDEFTRLDFGFRGKQNYRKRLKEYSMDDLYKLFRRRKAVNRYWNHISAAQVRENIGSEIFDKATKISIIRNPFDRLVSTYHWKLHTKGLCEQTKFLEWVKCYPHFLSGNNEHYFIEQKYILDHTIRYESLLEDCLVVETAIPSLAGLSELMKGISAKGGIRPKGRNLGDYYLGEDDLVATVKFFNREIINRFQYKPA